MLNSQDLRFMGSKGDVIPKRAEIIISKLQQYFVQATAERCNRLMLRFRSKGGQLDTVRKSMNTDVIDVFTTTAIKNEVLRLLEKELDFQVEFVEDPYCFYLIKWLPSSETETVEFLDSKNHCKILSVNTKYVIDTSDRSFKVKFPDNAINNDYVIISDRFGTFNTNNLRIDGNGQSILNDASISLDINYLIVKFIYVQEYNKWVMV